MTVHVTLEIDPKRVADGATVGLVGAQLIRLGGLFAAWTPDFGTLPATAKFEFGTADERDQFVVVALAIPGVSLSTED